MPIARSLSLLATALAAAFACGEPSSRPAGEEAPPLPPDTVGVAETGAAGDSVLAWAADIRVGIAPLAVQVETDPDAARKRAIELYVTRQERIEQTIGPGTGSAPDLADAVHEAEDRFHALMELLSESPPPSRERVAEAVAALDEGIGAVVALAGTADVAVGEEPAE
jgi:hypothetical protein